MDVADIRFMFAYDRWATNKVLALARTVPFEDWEESNRIDRRGLGGIMVHALGAQSAGGRAGRACPARPVSRTVRLSQRLGADGLLGANTLN